MNAVTKYAKEARRFDSVTLPDVERRQLDVLKNSLTMSAPPDPEEGEELTRLVAVDGGSLRQRQVLSQGRRRRRLPRHREDH